MIEADEIILFGRIVIPKRKERQMATATTFEFNTDTTTDLEENTVSYRRTRTPVRSRTSRPKYSRSGSRMGSGSSNGFHRRHSKKWAW